MSPAYPKNKRVATKRPRKRAQDGHGHPFIDPAMEFLSRRMRRIHKKAMEELVEEIRQIVDES